MAWLAGLLGFGGGHAVQGTQKIRKRETPFPLIPLPLPAEVYLGGNVRYAESRRGASNGPKDHYK